MQIRWVIKQPGADPEVHIFNASDDADRRCTEVLKEAQTLVGGYVELVPLGAVVLLCNEEGISKNLPANCGYLGTIILAANVQVDEDLGREWGSLGDDEVRKAFLWFDNHKNYRHPGDRGFKVAFGDEAEKLYQQSLRQKLAAAEEWDSL